MRRIMAPNNFENHTSSIVSLLIAASEASRQHDYLKVQTLYEESLSLANERWGIDSPIAKSIKLALTQLQKSTIMRLEQDKPKD